MKPMKEGLKTVLQCQKLTPVTQELMKDGTKEERHIVFKGEFNIFIEGQAHPMKLPAKLEFKDKPEIVGLIQKALSIEKIGEKCLMTVHSNAQGRIEEYIKELDKHTKQQQLDFGPKETDEDED